MRPLRAVERWPGHHAAAVIVAHAGRAHTVEAVGSMGERFPHASVTKVASAIAVLVVVEAGRCALDDEVGPPGATLAHLLSHASGLPTDGATPIAAPGTRRIYSNTGIEIAVAHAAAASRATPTELVTSRVFEPLGMRETALTGSAASGAIGPTEDLCALAAELLLPTLLSPQLAATQRTVAYPGLVGVLPGFGRQVPCDWGLGLEVKGSKRPHWTGETWPSSTVGHFGQSGGFVVADVEAGIAIVTLGDERFGTWSTSAWPAFTDAVRASH